MSEISDISKYTGFTVVPGGNADEQLEGRLYPVVRSEANPPKVDLDRARAALAILEGGEPKLVTIGGRLKMIAPSLQALESPPETIADMGVTSEALRYLRDEANQLDGPIVVDPITGRPLIVLQHDDFVAYKPGNPNALRLNPGLEGNLVMVAHEREREALAVAKANGVTAYVTRRGRRDCAEMIQKVPPLELLQKSSFLRQFQLVPALSEIPLEDDTFETEAVGFSEVKTEIQDLLTMNHRFDRVNAFRAVFAQEWVWGIGNAIFEAAPRQTGPVPLQEDYCWLAPSPDFRGASRQRFTLVSSLPGPVGALPEAGWIEVPPEFGLQHFDGFDRWELTAHVRLRIRGRRSRIWCAKSAHTGQVLQ